MLNYNKTHKYLQLGKPLPDKYRLLLFEDKREVELAWNDKINRVYNIVMPFQATEQVDEPRNDYDVKLQELLFDFDIIGVSLLSSDGLKPAVHNEHNDETD